MTQGQVGSAFHPCAQILKIKCPAHSPTSTTFAAATPFEVLCVCSDQTVGAKGHDEAIHSVADLAFPVTSDVDEVKNFLGGAGNRVVSSSLYGKMLWSILFSVSLFVNVKFA